MIFVTVCLLFGNTNSLKVWRDCTHVDQSAHPYRWPRPGFIPPSHFLCTLFKPHLQDLIFWSILLKLMPSPSNHGFLRARETEGHMRKLKNVSAHIPRFYTPPLVCPFICFLRKVKWQIPRSVFCSAPAKRFVLVRRLGSLLQMENVGKFIWRGFHACWRVSERLEVLQLLVPFLWYLGRSFKSCVLDVCSCGSTRN